MKKNIAAIVSLLLLLSAMSCTHKEIKTVQKKPVRFTIEEQSWGQFEGKAVTLYSLKASNGFETRITNYGATLVSLFVPDKMGRPGDVLLGYDKLEGYLQEGNPYIGCTVGRYANRIDLARFELNGKSYTLFANDGRNTLHGGKRASTNRFGM